MRNQTAGRRVNADCDWETFDQHEYVDRNYSQTLQADLAILGLLARFHESAPCGGGHIEIGVGPNLYPLMAAAQRRDRVHVTDISAANLRYVKSELGDGFTAAWKRWHSALRAVGGGYDTDETMARRLCEICTFEQVSVFDIPQGCYDSSSMMFVAESITNDVDEFAAALLQAVRCVRAGAPFVAALMLDSRGYNTGDATFPAVPVTRSDVEKVINSEADRIAYTEIGHNVRAGHDGMLFVAGRRKHANAKTRPAKDATAR